jgi:23S rRNA (uracil1939-C5)-methyltransferase
MVRDNLVRIGKTELPEVTPIVGSPDEFRYRNKLEYTFSSRRWLTHEEIISGKPVTQEKALGFHAAGLFDKVLDIRHCYLQDEPTNGIRNAVREYALEKDLEFFDYRDHTGYLRNLMIRNTIAGEVMVLVVFHHDDKKSRTGLLDFILEKFPDLTSLMYVINPKRNDSISDLDPLLYHGRDHLTEHIGSLRFRIGPKSFFQTNTRQSGNLYGIVKDFASLSGNEIVYDLYTGTGTIACFIAGSAGKVIGIEYIEEAVKDAEANSLLNGINNTSFFWGDIKNLMNDQFFVANGIPDVIITDPPRSGMHPDVVKAIAGSGAGKVVYVSCNPSTQARDINLMAENYKVTRIQPIDMFPHTHHVENVVLLETR